MTIPTLNISEPEIEKELRGGKSPAEISQEFHEPAGNVLAVYRRLRAAGEIGQANDGPATPPAATAPPPSSLRTSGRPEVPNGRPENAGGRPQRPVFNPAPEVKARIASATELLVRADGIEDKRVRSALTRARKAMTDLAAQVTRFESSTEARQEIADLEAQLAAARARLRGGAGKSRGRADDPNAVRIRQPGDDGLYHCTRGCDYTHETAQGVAGHERHSKLHRTADPAA